MLNHLCIQNYNFDLFKLKVQTKNYNKYHNIFSQPSGLLEVRGLINGMLYAVYQFETSLTDSDIPFIEDKWVEQTLAKNSENIRHNYSGKFDKILEKLELPMAKHRESLNATGV